MVADYPIWTCGPWAVVSHQRQLRLYSTGQQALGQSIIGLLRKFWVAFNMDVVKAVETYISKLVSTPSAMKVLLLDGHTTPIVSLAATQSTLLAHQVYLTDRVDNQQRSRMPHMKCVCFLQPSEESIDSVSAELREPKYGEYYLYFSNVLPKSTIERLAEADEFEVEYFADYAPLLPCLFSLNHTPTEDKPLYGTSPNTWDNAALERSVQGIIAVLLSLKKKPIIRYEKMSGMAKKLANEVQVNGFTPFYEPAQTVQAIVTNNAVPAWNKLRVVILYALRYQKTQTNNIAALINLLLANGVSQEEARLVYVCLNIAGADQRQDDLFSTESLLAKGKSALKGLKGVENVYTQHTPHLSQTLENLLKGRLRETSYPFLDDVIIFMVGGATYEEARTVALLNQDAGNTGTQILLGGTCVHNSSSYLEMLRAAAKNFPTSVYEPPPESASTAPSLNLNLGGVNVSLGGPGGTGVYRTSADNSGVQAEGIKDGVRSLFDKVKQGVDKIGLS
ncbi:hypothetical protein ID866_6275 [Astraeus odoratus]|nr:hypothetical protein ID866_6275 [Astraeus odoratus]